MVMLLIVSLLILIGLACLAMWEAFNQQQGSPLDDSIREINRIGEHARREMDEVSEDYLNKLRELTRR